jgi:hypothetical protein
MEGCHNEQKLKELQNVKNNNHYEQVLNKLIK